MLNNTKPLPLYVDLDDTLVRTDMLYESFVDAVKRDISVPIKAVGWVLRGRAQLKHKLANGFRLIPSLLPYNEEVLCYIATARAQGRRTYLATASHVSIGRLIAEDLGLFDGVLGSSEDRNLSGAEKLEGILAFEGEGFEYLGNSKADIPIWERAAVATIVEPSPGVVRWSGVSKKSVSILGSRKNLPLKSAAKAMRIHQWLKNFLVFVPLLASHKLFRSDSMLHAAVAFLAFGFCASGVYLINDMLDLAADRAHPRKRKRPFASGELPLKFGFIASPILFLMAAATCWFLPKSFFLVLLIYLVSTFAYSFWLKNKMAVDVVLLAALYTVRIIGGAAAISVVLSFWLLAFSVFFFFGLALVKRFVELRAANLTDGGTVLVGRDYGGDDIHVVMSLGSASSYVSVLVLALYINSADVGRLYTQPLTLWLLCPILLFWATRVWILAARGRMDDDPVVFAIKDRVSILLGMCAATCLLLATTGC